MSRFKIKPWMVLATVLLLLVIAFFGTFFITGKDQPSTAADGLVATSKPNSALEGVAGEVAAPSVSGINGFFGSISDFFSRLFATRDVDKEYEAQKIRIQQLEITNQLMQDLQDENERLNKLLGFEEKYPEYVYLPARVTGKVLPGSWFLYFTLNRGSNDGVEKEMIVVNELGLVGRVIKTGPTWCTVMAMIDRTSSIPIVVERSRDNGMVHGAVDPQAEEPSCDIYYLPNDADVVPGDRVVTSDFDDLTIKGIPVGVITAVNRDKKQQSMARATLVPYVDFAHLENVLIIKKDVKPSATTSAAPTAPASESDATASPGDQQPVDKGEGN